MKSASTRHRRSGSRHAPPSPAAGCASASRWSPRRCARAVQAALALPLLLLALFAGLTSHVVSPDRRINLLAPPLLAVLLWNLLVYAVLLGHAACGWRGARPLHDGWLQRAAASVSASRRPHGRGAERSAARPLCRRLGAASRPLLGRARLRCCTAALAVAAGTLAALYLRGLAFEFRAGWDSTFLGAAAVQRWLQLLLGPAAPIGHAARAPALEALRFCTAMVSRPPWIHLYAITTALVLLPRALLALAALSAPAAAAPLSAAARRSLLPAAAAAVRPLARRREDVVAVLPYATARRSQREALATLLAMNSGRGRIERRPTVPRAVTSGRCSSALGRAEDWPAVFALSATPERETHGEFLQAVFSHVPPAASCRVMIDESGFRRRLARRRSRCGSTAARGVAHLLDEMGAGPAWFVDLGPRA